MVDNLPEALDLVKVSTFAGLSLMGFVRVTNNYSVLLPKLLDAWSVDEPQESPFLFLISSSHHGSQQTSAETLASVTWSSYRAC